MTIKLDPYLNFAGNTEAAFNFYKKVFGGEFSALMRFGELPGADKMPEKDRNKLLHVSLPVGSSTLLGTDALESMNQKLTMGDNFHITIQIDNEPETRRIFDALSDGGAVILPLSKEFWADLYGMCKDKFGVQWMINYVAPKA